MHKIFLYLITLTSLSQALTYTIHGKGYTEFGKIMHVSDTLPIGGDQYNLSDNWFQTVGAQFTAVAQITNNLEGAFGFGGKKYHDTFGGKNSNKFASFRFASFITESRMTFHIGEKEAPLFSTTFGNFAFNYNKDVKNLGLYMLRGTVYPGFLESGFEHPRVDTSIGDFFGALFTSHYGAFENHLLIQNERQYAPRFDWHLGYITKYHYKNIFTLGAGFNYNRILPAYNNITSPKADSINTADERKDQSHPYDVKFFELTTLRDSLGNKLLDTTGKEIQVVGHVYSHAGIKLMGMFSFDPKPLLGLSAGEDLKVYGEIGLIGVKNQGKVYAKRSERIPIVIGFNLPTFGLLDVLSLEVEHYGARYKNDTRKLDYKDPNIHLPITQVERRPSAVPVSLRDYWKDQDIKTDSLTGEVSVVVGQDTIQLPKQSNVNNLTSDDIKWSLYAKKTIHKSIVFSGQIANDHFRPAPALISNPINPRFGTHTVFTTLKDWYFMFKIGYLF